MAAILDRWLYGALYRTGFAPWDISGAQPALVETEADGVIRGRVLDLGCGKGPNALFLAERGYEVAGIDLVPAAVSAARREAARRGLAIRFVVGDVFDLSAATRYDTLIDFGLLHHFRGATARAYLQKVAQLASDDGRLVFQCFSDRAPGWAGLAPNRFSEAELRDLFVEEWDLRELKRSHFQLKWAGSAAAWRGVASRRGSQPDEKAATWSS